MIASTNYELKIKKRIQLVHIAKQELHLSEEDYRTILAERFKAKSSKDLNFQKLGELLDFLKALGFKIKTQKSVQRGGADSAEAGKDQSWKKYPSSIDGLRTEICDLAKARWNDGWENSLNALVRGFGVGHWKWLDISHGKAVKAAILRMNREDKMTPPASEGWGDAELPAEPPF